MLRCPTARGQPPATPAGSGAPPSGLGAPPQLPGVTAPRDARHAYAVLAGLTSAAAAWWPPPRLAARAGEPGRNYDYRYVWIRDQCYAGQAVAAAGAYPLLDDAVRFVADRLLADGAHLRPAYTVDGDPVPDERRLDLPGYPGGTDLVGNWVNKQFQLDAFGEALLLFAAAARHDRLDAGGWRAAEIAADAIGARWHEPDAGIWELEPGAGPTAGSSAPPGCAQQRPPAASRPLAAGLVALADAIVADTAARPAPLRTLAAIPRRRPASTPRCCCPPIRGALPPTTRARVATLRAVRRGADRGRLLLPLPPRRAAAGTRPRAPSCSAAS